MENGNDNRFTKIKTKISKAVESSRSFMKKNSMYFLLLAGLCALGIAIVMVMPISTEKAPENGGTVNRSKDESIDEVKNPQPTPIATIRPFNEAWGTANNANTTPLPTNTSKPVDAVLLNPPVEGEIVFGFAQNELIYSKTLDCWTTHTGVDIACKLGTKVRAVDGGTVERVYEDTGFGVTVVVVHKNGHSSVYSNLAKDDTLIKEGTVIKANDVIGTTGETAQFECGEQPHLHFEYHINKSPVDPTLYVLFIG